MLLDGGDGINMFQDNNSVVQPVILDNQVLITYIQEYLGGVVGADYANAYGQGRITVLAGEAPEAPEAPAADGAVSDRWPGDGEPGIDWWYNNLLEGKDLWTW
jgi:hypothetical protein